MAPNSAITPEHIASLLDVLTTSVNTFGNALSSDGLNGKVDNGVNGVNGANGSNGHSSSHDVEKARISLLDTCETLLNVVSKPKERLKNMVLVVSIVSSNGCFKKITNRRNRTNSTSYLSKSSTTTT